MPMFTARVEAACGTKVFNHANGTKVGVGTAGWAKGFSSEGRSQLVSIEAEDRERAEEVLIGCMVRRWQARCEEGIPAELTIVWA